LTATSKTKTTTATAASLPTTTTKTTATTTKTSAATTTKLIYSYGPPSYFKINFQPTSLFKKGGGGLVNILCLRVFMFPFYV